MSVGIHGIATSTGSDVFDVAQSERPATILVALEFRDCRFGSASVVEANNTCATRPTTILVLDFGLLHLSDRREQLDQVLITS